MTDIADDAQQAEEMLLQEALHNAQANRLSPKGACYNCEEPLPPATLGNDQLFCDGDCGEDYQKRLHMSGGLK